MNVRKLAELTDLSVATISRVLKGEPVVDPETRERVLHAISQHPFYPDFKQKKKRTRNIFVFLSPAHVDEKLHQTQISFFSRALAGVKSHFDTVNSRDGVERYLLLSSFQSGRLAEKLSELEALDYAGSIAGIFVIHTRKADHAGLADYRGRLKLYLLGRSPEDVPGDHVNCVYFDDVKAGRLALEHLSGRGHRRVLVFSGPGEYTYFEKRERAFRREKSKNGNKFIFKNTKTVTAEEAYDLAKAVFGKNPPDITALYVTAEILLEGVLKYFDERGLRIPEDYSVLSTNDYLVGYQHNPPISVVRTPHFEIGRLAAVIALENSGFEYGTRVDYRLDVLLNDRKSVARI
jgi:DNA-binding LacI/PurR family transcriptional regulator